jgi:hypothetical protein
MPRLLTIRKLEWFEHLQLVIEQWTCADLDRCLQQLEQDKPTRRVWERYEEPIAVGQSWPTRILGDDQLRRK